MRILIISLLVLCFYKVSPAQPSGNEAATKGTLVFGIASVVSAEESISQYSDVGKYITERLGVTVSVVRSSNYADMNSMITSGRVSFASICTGALLYLDNVDVLVLPLVDNRSTYRSYIIANKSSEAKTVEELRGKTFAFTDPISNSGTLYPKYVLAKQFQSQPEKYFSKVYYTQSHDKSIYLVNRNVVTAAAVDSLIFEYIKKRNPEDVANIAIIDISPPFMSPPFVVSRAVPSQQRDKIRDILVNMHHRDDGKEILQRIGIDRFVIPQSVDIDTVMEMKKYVESIN